MAEDKSQKTEKPTQKRRNEAKKEGNIARTPDLSAWLGIFVFVVLGPATIDGLHDLFVDLMAVVQQIILKPDMSIIQTASRTATIGVLRVLAPLLLATMLVGSLGHIVQGGLRVSSKRVKPNWKKLNAITGIKQLFGVHAAWTFAKTLLKFVIFGMTAYRILRDAMDTLIGSGSYSLKTLIEVTATSAFSMLRLIAITGLVIAAVDYGMERRRVEKSLKMTKEQVKNENKQSEGDPHVKGAIKAKQREMGRRRMMQAVGEASVVMVNPTHVAVALTYTPGSGAPQVVAKGTGFLAERIRQEAEAHGVPMVRDVIVARTLYKLCDVGMYIPMELYDAIAHVLAYVFRLSERGSAPGTHDSPLRPASHVDDDLPEDLTDEAIGVRRSAAAA